MMNLTKLFISCPRFLSPEWKVEGVMPTPRREDVMGPFPNLDVNEPSDHIMIAADLNLDSQ